MDLPPPVHCPLLKIFKLSWNPLLIIVESMIKYAAKDLVKDGTSPTEIAVSWGGTWQKQYGHNSLLGATFIISIGNGCVLDYSVKSKTCAVCNNNPNPTDECSRNHELFCKINHKGSSASMEEEGAVEMFYIPLINTTSSMQSILVMVIRIPLVL